MTEPALPTARIARALAAADRNADLNVFLALDAPGATAAAHALTRRLERGDHVGPLVGVPIAVKDNLVVEGMKTTAGSRILANFQSKFTATAVRRLVSAGAVVIGKTNLDEFGMGSSTERSAYGPTMNPWNPRYVPGGSSGGSAAAVAAGIVPIALGSDTGGSIRQPAAYCGVVGLKPTWGRVSRYGLIAYASSLDTVGPIARTVRDAARALAAMAGDDPADMTASREPAPDFTRSLDDGVAGLRVGVLDGWLDGDVTPGVRGAVRGTANQLASAGADVRSVTLPDVDAALAAYYVIAPAEASSNLARYDGVRYGHRTSAAVTSLADLYARSRGEGFGPEVIRRILLGTFALSAGYYDAYYGRAQALRAELTGAFLAALLDVDVLLGPTTPGPAPLLGELQDPVTMALLDKFTISASLAGLPAIHVPTGLERGLPIGVQLIGRPFAEATLLQVARTVEIHSGFERAAS
ncbi:MAG: Asp-tRNA(Asn)/Glu-tRNA(Gln) amidotransferase subunit GatA [Myxococcales bacterium]|nr:Asp-tRNA(Asn)/Glu-tRNA(Gln) amidotransferase subunit GatA [Myxococcales bacterium]